MQQLHTLSRPQAGLTGVLSRIAGLTARILHLVYLARERRALRDLDLYLLDDIGIDRETALTEANRPFWDAPRHWQL